MCSWKPGLAVTLNGPLTSLSLRLLSCKMGPRTCVHVTGGCRYKHVPVRALGRAWPEGCPLCLGLSLSKPTESREHM